MARGEISAGTVYGKVIGGKTKPKRTVWFLDYYVDGRRIRKASRASSKTEAWALLRAETTDLERKEKRLPSKQDYRLKDVVDEYIEFKKCQGRRSTDRMKLGLDHLVEHLGDLYVSRITPSHLEAYRAKRKAAGLSLATINRECAALKNLYNVLRRQKKFSGQNPVLDIAFYPEPPRPHPILKGDEWRRLLDATEPRFQPILWLAVTTGLRRDDLLGLKWKNIDLTALTVTAFVAKTQQWITLPLSDVAREQLLAVPRREGAEYVFENPHTGGPFKGVQFWFDAARVKAGLPELRFHDLRANAGTQQHMAGIPLAVVSRFLGHSSTRMTEAYINAPDAVFRAAAQAGGDFFRRAADEKTPPGHQDSVSDTIKNN